MNKFSKKLLLVLLVSPLLLSGQKSVHHSFAPGKLWFDTNGDIINAHGGGILYHEGTYYWFGEHKGENSNAALVGVTCYSSSDLQNWKFERIALPVSEDTGSPIVKGCVIERPKVIYNKKANKFVMYFHLELKGQGYHAAKVGVAVSDQVTGPYTFLKSGRVNAGKWPLNVTKTQKNSKQKESDFKAWTPEWLEAMDNGLFLRRDFAGGQMSRDMTLFVDDDDQAYHIYSSEDNASLHVAELTDDYQDYTGSIYAYFRLSTTKRRQFLRKPGHIG